MPSDQLVRKAMYSLMNFGRQTLNFKHNPDTQTSSIDVQALIALLVKTNPKLMASESQRPDRAGKIRFKFSADGTIMTGKLIQSIFWFQ